MTIFFSWDSGFVDVHKFTLFSHYLWCSTACLGKTCAKRHVLQLVLNHSRCLFLVDDAEIACECCIPGAMKNSLHKPEVWVATGRQLLGWLLVPFVFHYFYLPPWIQAEGLSAHCYFPKENLPVHPINDSEPNIDLFTFMQYPSVLTCCFALKTIIKKKTLTICVKNLRELTSTLHDYPIFHSVSVIWCVN